MRIREIRKQLGMSAEDVAREIGVTQAAVSNWENGTRSPKIPMIIRLAEVFDCTTDELLGYERRRDDTKKAEA